MNPVNDFIKQYNKEFDFYQELARKVANKLEDQIFKRGIKAIVTHRAKRPDRLKEKLLKRVKEKNYQSKEDISDDIVDLAGIRVSLYFPSERDVVDEIINDTFIVDEKKIFPSESYKPRYEKRFSGYWANHYRVKLKGELNNNNRYRDTIAEIQVASVLMHAWSEVEHDLVYKPISGNLSKEEASILDEINGLVLSGEIALERLQIAIADRTKKQNEITDKYELTNYILAALKDENIKNIKLGDPFLLNNFNNNVYKINLQQLNEYIKRLNTELSESVTDQLLDMMLSDKLDIDTTSLKKYFKTLLVSERKASGFESFVKCWVILEKAVRDIQKMEKLKLKKYLIPDFSLLKEQNIITEQEADELSHYRRIRNNLLHGIETPQEEYLRENFESLKAITKKIVTKVPTRSIKESLKKELNEI